MIELQEDARNAVLSGSFQYRCSVDVYFDSKRIYNNVPITDGFEEIDSGNDVQGRAEFRVPRRGDDNFNWSPTYTSHPLAPNGQRILVTLGVGMEGNEPDWFRRAWWRIIATETEGDEVVVSCADPMWIVAKATFAGTPFDATGTFGSTLRQLVSSDQGAEFGIVVDDSLTDRNIPDAIVFNDSRIGAFHDVLDAWPAEGFFGQNAYLTVRPLLESRTSLLTLTHGVGGTVIEASGENTSEQAWNCVVVHGKDPDGAEVSGTVFNTDPNHPKQYGGPFSRLPIPLEFTNDMVSTYQQARNSATHIMKRKKRQNAAAFTVTMVPNPTLQIGDVLTLNSDITNNQLVEITSLRLPYLHSGGPMDLVVRAI